MNILRRAPTGGCCHAEVAHPLGGAGVADGLTQISDACTSQTVDHPWHRAGHGVLRSGFRRLPKNAVAGDPAVGFPRACVLIFAAGYGLLHSNFSRSRPWTRNRDAGARAAPSVGTAGLLAHSLLGMGSFARTSPREAGTGRGPGRLMVGCSLVSPPGMGSFLRISPARPRRRFEGCGWTERFGTAGHRLRRPFDPRVVEFSAPENFFPL